MSFFSDLRAQWLPTRRDRLDFVLRYPFPKEALASLDIDRRGWPDEKIADAWSALRQFLCLPLLPAPDEGRKAARAPLEMPSAIADEAWHAFLRFPEEYDAFCKKAYGFRLSHIPDPSAEPRALRGSDRFKPGVHLAWTRCSQGQAELPGLFGPKGSTPLLFAVDRKWNDGWIWSPEALRSLRHPQKPGKAGESSGSGCGSSCSIGSCGSGSSACADSGGSSGSDSGSSCGSGCGGGGD